MGQAQVSPAMQFGAQLKQQAIKNALDQKEAELQNLRTGIQIQKYFSDKEFDTYRMAGTAQLAQTMAGFRDMTDPGIPEAIYGVLSKNPYVAKEGEQFLDNHRQALQFKQRQEEVSELRMSRERIAEDTLRLRGEQYQFQRETTTRKLDMLGEHYENQDEVAKLNAEMKVLENEKNDFYRSNRLLQIDREADRLEGEFRLRREQFDAKQKAMTPERRLLYQNKVKALSDEAVLGKVMDPKTGKRSAEEYQRRSKAIEDKFFGGSSMPLNTNLKNPISKEEYDKLPVGAEYIAPDGSTRVKK